MSPTRDPPRTHKNTRANEGTTLILQGMLAAKTLTQGVGLATGATSIGFVQALDMLIVQASVNTIASHFLGLCTGLHIKGAVEAVSKAT